MLNPVLVTNSTYPVEVKTVFNGSAFTSSATSANTVNALSSSGPVYAYYGYLANNLTLPLGAKDNLAYAAFGPKERLPPNSRLFTTADVMIPQFECEAAKVTPDPIIQDPGLIGSSSYATVEAPSCTVGDVTLLARDPKRFPCPPQQIIGQWSLVDCKAETTTGSSSAPWAGGQPDVRFMVAITDFRYTQTPAYSIVPDSGNQTVFNATDFSTAIESTKAVICKPAYSIIKANLTYDTSKQEESDRFFAAVPEATSGQILNGFSFDNLSKAVDLALSMSDPIVGIETFRLEPEVPDIVSKLMLLAEGESSLKSLLADSEAMTAAAAKALNGVAAQYAQQSLLEPTSETSAGLVVYPENRLKVQTTSMALIVASLVLLICLTFVVLFTRPHNVVPRKPDSLAAMTVFLASSQYLQSLLTDMGGSPTSSIRQRLSTIRLSTQVSNGDKGASFRIEPSETDPKAEILGEATKSHRWHRPLPSRKGFIAVILPLPIIIIGVLEGLQQASNRGNGFMTLPKEVSRELNSTAVLIRYLPALFMLLVAALFNMLDFTVTTFAPFSALRAGSSPARRSIFSRLVGQLPPIALYQAAVEHHWGALFSSLASLTGSFLAIIVSGLLVVENIHLPSNVIVRQRDSFTVDKYNISDGNATATLSLIEQLNLSFPVFTYEGLAFPSISLSPESPVPAEGASTVDNMSLSVTLPALRASLNCKPVPRDSIKFAFNQSPYMQPGPQVVLQTKIDLPEGCSAGATTDYNFSFPVADGLEPTYVVPDSDDGWSFAGAIADITNITIQSSDCPALAFFFGSFKMNVTSHDNVTVMSCSEHMDEVQTLTTFLLPNLNIDSSHPPVVDEASSKRLRNTSSGHSALQYSVTDKFHNNILPFYSFTSGIGDQRPLDQFFQALTLGSDAIPPPQLLGPANAATLVDRTTHLYRKYMAQLINSDMRTAPLYPNPTYNATLAVPTPRLKQNNPSKLTLQILLAVMFVCASLAYWLTDMRHTLPHNPHTLAGSMSLLAGSEMCSRNVVPEGAEWMSDDDLREAGVFEGYLFSLGWWEAKDGLAAVSNHREEGVEKQKKKPKQKQQKQSGPRTGTGTGRFGIDVGRAEKAS